MFFFNNYKGITMVNDVGRDNPFIYGKMIKDPEKFWGRAYERYALQNRLHNMESTSIVGPRRIGKSSLAYFVYSAAKRNFDDTYHFVWLDGQSTHVNSVKDFCSSVATRGSIEYVPANDGIGCLKNFEDAVTSCGKKLVLIINEFELLTDEHHQEEFNIPFFNTLRMLAEQGECALVTTSNQPVQELCKHVLGVSSPFYNILSQITLSVFSEDEVNGFLSATHNGVSLEEREIDIIKSVPDYQHPLVLQIACHHLFLNRKIDLPTKDIVARILEQSSSLLNHDDVHEERIMARKNYGG